MLKIHVWLAVMCVALHSNVIRASDDREHVHIKVHMPEVVRKHNHYHKVKKHQQPHQPLLNHHQLIDVGLSYAHDNLGPQFFPTPLAALPEPELVGGVDEDDDNANANANHANYAADTMSAIFETDSLKFAQPYRPAMPPPPPPPPPTTTYLRQQLMQQLFAPEIMSVLAGGGAIGGGGVGGGGAGSGEIVGDTNSLLADEFLNELKKEYAKKLQKHKTYAEKLPMSQEKFRKRKKYARDGHHQQQLHKQFDNSFHSNNLYDMRPKLHSYQHHQQQLQQDFNDDLSDTMEAFDDKSSAEDNFSGEAFPDMYAAFTQSSILQHPASTTPTGLNWRPFQQQTDHFLLPSMRLEPTPYSFPLNSKNPSKVAVAGAVTSTQPTTSHFYETSYKKRKRRNKPKRNQIVV